jgi:dephospho-CoA kinase
MLKVGITGGIGSGKSTVCQVFETLGISVFYADSAAKYLMEHDKSLIQSVKKLFGDDAYVNGKLNNKMIGAIVFKDKDKLAQLNAITHPAVFRYSDEWMNRCKSPYAIKEAALFFETDSYQMMDLMIGVNAPKPLRIARTMQRDHINEDQVLDRMAKQMDEEEKMKRCDYIITNDDQQAIIPQVLALHKILLQQAQGI